MIYVIIGRARAGKTTAANILSELTGLKNESTSHIIYNVVAKSREMNVNRLKCQDKETIRKVLIDVGDYLCSLNPIILSEGLINSGYQIIDGIRRLEELIELKKKYKITVIKIHRNSSIDDNFNIPDEYVDYNLDNNYSKEDLKIRLQSILSD